MGTITTITGSASIFPERLETSISIKATANSSNKICLVIKNLIPSDVGKINWDFYGGITQLILYNITNETLDLLIQKPFYQQARYLSLRKIHSDKVKDFPSPWVQQLQGLEITELDLCTLLALQKHSFSNLEDLVLQNLDEGLIDNLNIEQYPLAQRIITTINDEALAKLFMKLQAYKFKGELIADNNICDATQPKVQKCNQPTSISNGILSVTPKKRAGCPLPGPAKKNRKRLNDESRNQKQAELRDTLHFHMYSKEKSLLEVLQEQAKSTTNTVAPVAKFRPQ